MIGQVFVAFKAIREGSGRPRPFALLTREGAKTLFWDCPTFKAIMPIFVDPF
jgi:hypothetical protein